MSHLLIVIASTIPLANSRTASANLIYTLHPTSGTLAGIKIQYQLSTNDTRQSKNDAKYLEVISIPKGQCFPISTVDWLGSAVPRIFARIDISPPSPSHGITAGITAINHPHGGKWRACCKEIVECVCPRNRTVLGAANLGLAARDVEDRRSNAADRSLAMAATSAS